jgi:DNA-binding NtrC family response regulator
MNEPVGLVADEDQATRTIVANALNRFGLVVLEAASFAAAETQVNRQPVRLLFLDLQLPETGAERLIALVQSRWPESSLVVMTRHPSIESAVDAVRMGACDYLAKPLSPEEIQTACQRALGLSAEPSDPVASTSLLELVHPERLAELTFQNAASVEVQYHQQRFDSAVPAEMTVNVPLVGDFRKISQCLVREALVKFHGNKAAAARALGIHRKTLYRLLQADRGNSNSA